MSVGADPLDELVIPDGTTVGEEGLVTAANVFIGRQSVIEGHVRGNTVIAGDRVRVSGDIEAEGGCRLNMWCDVAGNVCVDADAHVGERVHIGEHLLVGGNLDIGDNVDIEDGFEVTGWIVTKNPMPAIVVLFVYLSQLLRIGEGEPAEEVVAEVLNESDTEDDAVLIPRRATVTADSWRVSTSARIGAECRLATTIRATTIEVGRDTEVVGSLRAKGDISLDPGTVIHGDVTTRRGTVRIPAPAQIHGDISCEELVIHDGAEVDGAIRARSELTIVGDESDGRRNAISAAGAG